MTGTEKRFTYHKVQGKAVDDMRALRGAALQLAYLIEAVVPDGTRERSLALSKLVEVVMWANAGIAIEKGEPVDR